MREQGAKLTEEEHFIASMLYDDEMGTNVTESFHGAEAARRMKPLFPKAESLVEAQGQATDEHVLFSFRSPSNGLVGFEIQGLLSDNKLQLSVQMLLERVGATSQTRLQNALLSLCFCGCAGSLSEMFLKVDSTSLSSEAVRSHYDTQKEDDHYGPGAAASDHPDGHPLHFCFEQPTVG